MRYLLLSLLSVISFLNIQAQNCEANFTFEGNMLTYEFTDLSTTSDGPIVDWSWNFDDGSTSNQQNPTHTFPEEDDYDVCLTITTQGGCTDELCIEIVICQLNINVVQGNCDANDNIPIDITITDTYGNAKEIDVFIDGTLDPGSPYDIEDNMPVIISTEVPGDGLVHNVSAQSLDIGTCMAVDSFSVPDCGSNCFLSSMSTSIANPMTHNVDIGDNFFNPSNITIEVGDIVQWVWVADGHTTTSDASSGPDSWHSGELNAPATYQHQFQTVGTHNYYCVPHGGPGGTGMSGVVVANCPSGTNNIDYNVSFNTSIADPQGFNVYVDGNLTANSPYNYSGTGTNTFTLSLPGDGTTKTIMIEDVATPSCTISRDVTTPDCGAAPSCTLTLSAAQTGGCDPNNDIPYDITVSDINGGSAFTVSVDGNTVPGSPFNYNSSGTTTLTINVPGDGLSHTITATDSNDPNCTDNTSVTPPDCATPCSITNLQITTGQPSKHIVDVMDFDFQPANLSITEGDTVEFVWVGSVDHTSTSDATSGPDSWDSGLLNNGATFQTPILSIGNHPYYCVPHGAPGGVGMSGTITVNPDCNNGMVSATLTFQSSGTGFNGFNVFVDGNPDSGNPYTYDPNGNNAVNILLPGDGQSHTISIEDVDDPTCGMSTNFTTTDCNQTAPCELTLAASINGSCDNNNEVPIDLTITNLNSSTQFDLLLDGNTVPGSPFNYDGSGTTNLTINVPGDGQSHSIEVVDAGDPNCTANTSISTPDCSIPCALTNLQVSTGTAVLHTVQVADFDFQPSTLSITEGDTVKFVWTGAVDHTTTSDATSGPDSWDSGLLGNGSTFQIPILSTGNHPYYCVPHGAPGGVGMSGTITVNPDCNNGMVSATLTFQSSGTGASGFNLFIDGSPDAGNPYAYDPNGNNSVSVLIPGDGQSHSISIEDVDDPTCQVGTNFTTTDCNQTAPCELTLAANINGACDGNNEVAVDLTITNLNSGNQFDLLLDGNNVPGSPFNYDGSGTTNLTINVPGDGQGHNIEIVDLDDQSCVANTTVNTPDCSVPCSITNMQLSSGQSVVHTVEVADFDFIPQNIVITEGDTVEFVWTGAVDHTTTSDAPSGPDSWDSGLLGNGSTFITPVLSIGNHPYYCIPHGAPGGVGMSGTIVVNPNCNNGLVSASLNFQSSGTGPNGYNVFIDGNPDSNNPYNYDPSGDNTVNLLLPGDGQTHTISIEDVNEPACSASIDYTTADCNQTAPCELTLSSSIAGSCDNNDEVAVDLTITNLNSGNQFDLLLDGNTVPGSPFNYDASGTTQMTVNVPGDGQAHNIEVVDIDDAQCNATSSINTPDCTNNSCSIDNLNVSSDEPISRTVHVKDFSFEPETLNVTVGDTVNFVWVGQVAHTTTSDATSGPDSWDSGLLDQGAEYQIIIQSEGSHPYYCVPHGGPGGVGMAGVINASNACDNGLVNVNIYFESDRTAFDSYNVMFDGGIVGNSPYNYSPNGINNVSLNVNGDGQTHNIEIRDVQIPSCNATDSIVLANCGGSGCTLGIEANNISACDPDGNFTVDLDISGVQNSNAGFDLYVNSVKLNNTPYPQPNGTDTTITITLLGDGTMKNIEVRDVNQSNCTNNTQLQAPVCGDFCVLTNLSVSSMEPATHQVDVLDFEFAPKDIQIIQGDSVRFIWKGEIDHSTTSDTTSGPDSWDSGVIGKGSEFTISPNNIGDHPYYCIPHGGPGGIGMSGTIEVLPQCEGDSALISASFTAQNAGTGYNIFVDGKKVNDTLVQYSNSNGNNSFSMKILGDGLVHTLTIQDSLTSFCALSQTFMSPQCGPPCVIENFEVNQGADIEHVIAVRDFDFAPEQKTVGLGETIRFIWTGDIPHSTTSDATSGPDSWNSGIIGKGANYEVQLQTPGEHSYYCIPHGGPGGIGMAGTITAIPNCKNGQDKVQYEFKVRGGSPEGYNLYVDGNLHPSSPFAYDNPNGTNKEILYLPGDGQTHLITVQDKAVDFCAFTDQITTRDCNTACLFEQLNVNIDVPSKDTVDVADFEFIPKNVQIESGDTLIFDFIGDIAHTVTSDATSGPTVFNSGLLGKGAVYKLTIDEEGEHPYYCIPHGGPGGIGMAGNIEVTGRCADNRLNVALQFDIIGQSTAYNVYVDGALTSDSPVFYTPGKTQDYTLKLPANGQLVEVILEDVQQPNCEISSNILMPDCSDPCYPYRASFTTNVNPSLLEVAFENNSAAQGDVDYTWNFGDGNSSTMEHPTHSYERVGTYEVCLTLESTETNCSDTICKDIVVGQPSCDGDFTMETDGLSIELNGVAQTNVPNVTYQWDFGDGQSANGKSQQHTFTDLGIYNICLNITADTCEVEICKEIDLSDSCLLLQANFKANVNSNQSSVQFTNLSSGNYSYILWGFGDGNTSTEMNPVHTYSKDGIYNVCLVLRDEEKGCSDYHCFEVEVGNVASQYARQRKDWVLYPNPLAQEQSSFYLQSSQQQNTEPVNAVHIIDMYGQVVYQKEFSSPSIEDVIRINMSKQLPSGTYYVKAFTGQKIEVHKLIIQ